MDYETVKEIEKSMSNLTIDKGLLAWQLVDLQKFMEDCISKDKLKDLDDRIDILMYNVAMLIQSRVYKKHYGEYDTDLPTKFSDILMITLAACTIAKIPLTKVVELGVQRYHDRVWEKKYEVKNDDKTT